MNVSTSNGNNTKYDAGLMRRRYVPGTCSGKVTNIGTGKVTSTCTSEAETEETTDEKRTLRNFRVSNEAKKQKVSEVWIGNGFSQATYREMGLRGL